MKLQEIKLSNFRQFYGHNNSIIFAEGKRNITVIFGDNGEGKTGIFRALMFGLFGTQHLSQDNDKDEIHLVNMRKLQEDEGKPVSAKVHIRFEHENVTRILEREIVGIQNQNSIQEKEMKVSLRSIDQFGNFSSEAINDRDEVSKEINGIIDEKIKDFFLFDGEKIETLAKTNKKVKTEIKDAIIKLLQIDKVDYALEILNEMVHKEQTEITKKSANTDVQKAQDTLDEIDTEIAQHQTAKDTHEENLASCKQEIENTELQLSEAKPIREIQKNIQGLMKDRESKVELLRNQKKFARERFFTYGHNIFMEGIYPNTKTYLNQLYVKQKDLIPIEVIKKVLEENACICGTDLTQNSLALQSIHRLAQNFEKSKVTPLIGQISGAIDDYEKEREDLEKGIRDSLTMIMQTADKVDGIEEDIKESRNKIKDISKNEENLAELEDRLEGHREAKEGLIKTINKTELKIEELEKSKLVASREYERIIGDDLTLRKDQKRLLKTKDLRDQFDVLLASYSDHMRKELMNETTRIFKTLIDKKDRELINTVEINPKYELELHSWNDTKITQDISQGQRQVVALAFITALAKVAAAGRENIDFPLFMDTPFGRMSGANRDNLIQNIPVLASQWILLLTDTEFSESEELVMKSTNKLGRWYRLNQKAVGHTEIVELELEEKMSKRR